MVMESFCIARAQFVNIVYILGSGLVYLNSKVVRPLEAAFD